MLSKEAWSTIFWVFGMTRPRDWTQISRVIDERSNLCYNGKKFNLIIFKTDCISSSRKQINKYLFIAEQQNLRLDPVDEICNTLTVFPAKG